MTRARAFAGAVPQRVWTAVAGLALLASIAVAAVIGAGLSAWRSAVGSSAQPPTATLEPPSSGFVVLPGAPPAAHHVVPSRHAPAAPPSGPVFRAPSVPSVPSAVRPASFVSTTTPATSTPLTFIPRLVVSVTAPDGSSDGDTLRVPAQFSARLAAETQSQVQKLAARVEHQAVVHARHEGGRHAARHTEKHATRHHARHAAKHHARHAANGRHGHDGEDG